MAYYTGMCCLEDWRRLIFSIVLTDDSCGQRRALQWTYLTIHISRDGRTVGLIGGASGVLLTRPARYSLFHFKAAFSSEASSPCFNFAAALASKAVIAHMDIFNQATL